MSELAAKTEKLKEIVQQLESVVVAYSGGVDSTLVLKVCVDVLNADRVLAVTAVSASYPARELQEAQKVARLIGARHRLLETAETMTDVVTRVQAVLDDITDTHREQTVLLVAHGGSLQVLLCLALGLAPRARWQFRLDPGSLSELHLYVDGAVLTLLNDTHHLAEVKDDR